MRAGKELCITNPKTLYDLLERVDPEIAIAHLDIGEIASVNARLPCKLCLRHGLIGAELLYPLRRVLADAFPWH